MADQFESSQNVEGTVVVSNATGFNGGTVAIGTAAVEVTFTGTPKSIFIQADHDNGTMVYIGPSNVAQTGSNAITRLNAGEGINIDLNDTSAAVYAVGGTTGQKIYKLAIT